MRSAVHRALKTIIARVARATRTGSGDWTYNAQLPQYEIRAYDRDHPRD